MYSRINSAVCSGIEGRGVFVETDIGRGLPGIGMVGLPSTMVMESRERIKSAIINSGFDFPKGKITINLTPASLRKNSSCLDLPMAVGILESGGCIGEIKDGWGIIGELSLDGRVLGVDGALPMMLYLLESGMRGIIVPVDNAAEAALAGGNIHAVKDIQECVELICRKPEEVSEALSRERVNRAIDGLKRAESTDSAEPDFRDIVGQEKAKRAVTIAASGRHGLLMIGSPGCGKTMIAGRMAGVMPAMTERERLEAAIVRSVTGRSSENIAEIKRPFRDPHHTIGRAGLIGGGSYPVPGEITLAHNGVLFLDEICEFNKEVIESLRLPLEEKKITHFRKGEAFTFPCDFQVLMAANPCPCGFLGDRDRECTCTQADLDRYRRKLSGPIMDRIDMTIRMEKVEYSDLTGERTGLTTEEMRKQVIAALEFAKKCGRDGYNSDLDEKQMNIHCALGKEEKAFMRKAYSSFSMSPRSYTRALKVSRTIADLDASEEIKIKHLAEALNYRLQE